MLELLFSNPYPVILAITLILSPFILFLAANQKKETKQRLKFILMVLLSIQIALGFLNWENFAVGLPAGQAGRSGLELSLSFPGSLLGLFFVITLLQVIFLVIGKSLNTAVVVLNFINSVVIFMGMIKLSNILGFQALSFASVGAVFSALTGNIIGLAYINKDKNLLKKYLK